MNRRQVKVECMRSPTTSTYAHAVAVDGEVLVPDGYVAWTSDNKGTRWHAAWEGLLDDVVVFTVTSLAGSRVQWEPIRLPDEVSDRQIRTIERIMNLYGLSLFLGHGLTKRRRQFLQEAWYNDANLRSS